MLVYIPHTSTSWPTSYEGQYVYMYIAPSFRMYTLECNTTHMQARTHTHTHTLHTRTHTGTLAAAASSVTAAIPFSDNGRGVAAVPGPRVTPNMKTVTVNTHTECTCTCITRKAADFSLRNDCFGQVVLCCFVFLLCVFLISHVVICMHIIHFTWYTGVRMASHHFHWCWLWSEREKGLVKYTSNV